jgi:predicted unusual protein kinase regulating ubiquinone biosynthesis (AarF/ABC1/UbiB family)
VAHLVSQTFNEMIFRYGFVHCDPHAGNLLVRMKDGRPQLVLLDHGLYREVCSLLFLKEQSKLLLNIGELRKRSGHYLYKK